MDIHELNLELLSKQYRHKGAPKRGYNVIRTLWKKKKELAWLLRNHLKEEIVDDEEIYKRDDVDYYLDYWSMVAVGQIAGYFPFQLPAKLQSEASAILKKSEVRNYYDDYYKIYLPQFLLQEIENGSTKLKTLVDDDQEDKENKILLFEEFLFVIESKRADPDIDQFLWFLDDGNTEGYDIDDLLDILKKQNTRKRNKILRKPKNPLNKALIGYIKYTDFISDYAALLKNTDKYPILQSAIWHYQSYWFKNIRNKMGRTVLKALDILSEAIEESDSEELIANNSSPVEDMEGIGLLMETQKDLEIVKQELDYVLAKKHGTALIKMITGKEDNNSQAITFAE